MTLIMLGGFRPRVNRVNRCLFRVSWCRQKAPKCGFGGLDGMRACRSVDWGHVWGARRCPADGAAGLAACRDEHSGPGQPRHRHYRPGPRHLRPPEGQDRCRLTAPPPGHIPTSAPRTHPLQGRPGLRELEYDGTPITFESVARTAAVSSSWLYTQPDLRTELERLRQTTRRSPDLLSLQASELRGLTPETPGVHAHSQPRTRRAQCTTASPTRPSPRSRTRAGSPPSRFRIDRPTLSLSTKVHTAASKTPSTPSTPRMPGQGGAGHRTQVTMGLGQVFFQCAGGSPRTR